MIFTSKIQHFSKQKREKKLELRDWEKKAESSARRISKPPFFTSSHGLLDSFLSFHYAVVVLAQFSTEATNPIRSITYMCSSLKTGKYCNKWAAIMYWRKNPYQTSWESFL